MFEDKPFIHFWIQVKSSKDFPNREDEVTCSFKTSSLKYWERQPVPVIAVLVPIEWPPEQINYIHIIDITLSILINGINPEVESQTLKSISRLAIPINDISKIDEKLEGLLLHHLPMTISAMYSKKGFLYAAPKPTEEYLKYYSGHILDKCIPQIELNIKNAATFAVTQFIDSGKDYRQLPKSLITVLEAMEDENHFHVFEAKGVLLKAKGNYQEAIIKFQKAIHCINRDSKKSDSEELWNDKIKSLEKRIQECNIETNS